MARGSIRKSRKKYRYSVNRKKLRRKSRRLPGIENDVIRKNWIYRRSAGYNLKKMGLSADPNASIKVPSTRELLLKALPTDEEPKKNMSDDDDDDDDGIKEPTINLKVIPALEEKANRPHKPGFHVSLETSMFAKYMTDKYDINYKAMCRDPKNYYQLTPRQMKKKIKDTKRSQMLTAMRIVKMINKREAKEASNDTSP